jgi:hypothetical protein
VNSFWLSGCGVARAVRRDAAVKVDETLRDSALAGDWGEWREAWVRLDAGPIADLLRTASGGARAAITLCGERHAQTFASTTAPWTRAWRRLTAQPARAVLETL